MDGGLAICWRSYWLPIISFIWIDPIKKSPCKQTCLTFLSTSWIPEPQKPIVRMTHTHLHSCFSEGLMAFSSLEFWCIHFPAFSSFIIGFALAVSVWESNGSRFYKSPNILLIWDGKVSYLSGLVVTRAESIFYCSFMCIQFNSWFFFNNNLSPCGVYSSVSNAELWIPCHHSRNDLFIFLAAVLTGSKLP